MKVPYEGLEIQGSRVLVGVWEGVELNSNLAFLCLGQLYSCLRLPFYDLHASEHEKLLSQQNNLVLYPCSR